MNNNEIEDEIHEQKQEFKRTDKVRPSLKAKDSPRVKRDSKVTWDQKQLEELEQYKKDHPVTKHIDEPKTPYNRYEVRKFI